MAVNSFPSQTGVEDTELEPFPQVVAKTSVH